MSKYLKGKVKKWTKLSTDAGFFFLVLFFATAIKLSAFSLFPFLFVSVTLKSGATLNVRCESSALFFFFFLFSLIILFSSFYDCNAHKCISFALSFSPVNQIRVASTHPACRLSAGFWPLLAFMCNAQCTDFPTIRADTALALIPFSPPLSLSLSLSENL